MSEQNDQEKTEEPSQKRLDEARKKGDVARSSDIPSAFILLSSMLVFLFFGSFMFSRTSDLMREIFMNMGTFQLDENSLFILFRMFVKQSLLILLPLMLAVLTAGFMANVFQIGFLITGEPLVPNFARLNPLEGIKRLLSVRSLIELMKSLFKMVTVAAITFFVLRSEIIVIPHLLLVETGNILSYISDISLKVILYVCIGLFFLGIADYMYQRWEYEKKLRMTKQQVKEEHKHLEGDPQVRSRIKGKQMEMARRRMMEAVIDANVVISNPTHLAVALAYDKNKMTAPRVVAKGAGFIAEKIKKIAAENSVPVVENKPLAQVLYKTVDIGRMIPPDLYRAVAEVLAYVYRLQNYNKKTKW
ncbi:MAG: flagellar biosynthesis protein FlhB [Desulfococcaceae bacterium]|jgi:flagellar biosynthetic protein FlhB|nr:flagellar biosynthesis protein FlhB [Desulfococcaceae bacterium]